MYWQYAILGISFWCREESQIRLYANNNISKTSFDSLIEVITKSSVISLTHIGATLMTRRNRDFTVEHVYACNKPKGMCNIF